MTCGHVKENLLETICDLLQQNRCFTNLFLMQNRYMPKTRLLANQMGFIYDLSETWVKENVDSHLNWLYRKWLQLPISANITHLQMPQSKLFLNITSAKKLHSKCKLSVRRILNTSPNLEVGNFTKSQALNMLIQTQS